MKICKNCKHILFKAGAACYNCGEPQESAAKNQSKQEIRDSAPPSNETPQVPEFEPVYTAPSESEPVYTAPPEPEPEPEPALRELLFEAPSESEPSEQTQPSEENTALESFARAAEVSETDSQTKEKLPPWKIALQDLTGEGAEPAQSASAQKPKSSSASAPASPSFTPPADLPEEEEYEPEEDGVETFISKKHADAENPYVDLLKKYGLSPLFLIGAAIFSFLSIFLTYIKVGEFLEYIRNTMQYKDSMLQYAALMELNPLETKEATAQADQMLITGYINTVVYLLTLIPTCLYLIGFILNTISLSGSDRARKRAPGCFYIRIAATCGIVASGIILLAYMREAYLNLTGLPTLYQTVQIVFFLAIQLMSIYVNATVIKITKNLNHVITTGRYSEDFSRFLPKIVIILAFVQLGNFVLLFGNATLNDWLALVQAAGTVLMAFAFAQFSTDYNRLHEMRKTIKKA
ncbi:MAG: hypothetical protein FWH08_03080 [Oscillospiraceae bacterium]|nr:hypothetical protein [Oscillospiraceae bacterium]